ncbi:MAG: hypothetical protein ACI88A_003811, partial [Paraglaciecola sp.]
MSAEASRGDLANEPSSAVEAKVPTGQTQSSAQQSID